MHIYTHIHTHIYIYIYIYLNPPTNPKLRQSEAPIPKSLGSLHRVAHNTSLGSDHLNDGGLDSQANAAVLQAVSQYLARGLFMS